MTFYVYNNTYPKTYASNMRIRYQTIDPTDIVVNVNKTEYKAFEKVNPESDILKIKLYYGIGNKIENQYIEELKEEILNSVYTINYCNQADSFRTGDTYYTIKGKNQYGVDFEKNVNVTVGESTKTLINPSITVQDKVYDGSQTIPTDYISISNLEPYEYTVISATSSSANAGETIANVTIRLSDEKFEEYSFENGMQEKEFSVEFKIDKAELYVRDLSKNVTVKYDGNAHTIKMDLESDGGAILKYMNEENEYILDKIPEYTEIGTYKTKYKLYLDDNHKEYFGERTLTITEDTELALGDINADGKINARDAKMALQQFTGKIKLTEDQKSRADVNDDGKINARDAKMILQYFTGKIKEFK